MKYITYNEDKTKTKFKYCILAVTLNSKEIYKEYISPYNIDESEVVVLDLFKTGKKTLVKDMREYAEELYEAFRDMEVEYIIVADSDYYKIITNQKKAEANLGYIQLCISGLQKVIYVPNYQQVFYDPEMVRAKIKLSMEALVASESGQYQIPGIDIIKHVEYPQGEAEIIAALQRLFNFTDGVSCDIEGFSLKFSEAGLGTITFCWNENEGIAFPVDFLPHSKRIREILKDFFIHYPYKIIFHNASFDVTVLIYQLFMEHIEDTNGLLFGLEVFMGKIEDTKIIAYLATNTCAGNVLGLKPLSQDFSGNYAIEEIKDITKIPLEKLLEYNLIDGLSTWYVFKKYYSIMVEDCQEDLYRSLFMPALMDIIQMQLTGMPISPEHVQKAKKIMEGDRDKALNSLHNNKLILEYEYDLKEKWAVAKNQKLKKKRVTAADAPKDRFNPNSDQQLQGFLFEKCGLPVLKRTDSNQPSTKGEVLSSLLNKTDDPDLIKCLNDIIDFKDVIIILTTFISAFEKAIQGPSGQYYLFGNFNLGGTKSGRLSSNDPNLQNIPSSGTKYAKIIKQCFRAIAGKLFVGLDFSSLEDRISALTTKDTNKLKVYTDGYDGHCLRAQFYFDEQMPDIDPTSVESINSIANKYADLRQDSKVPTFLLTYGGTWIGIVDKCGFSEVKAKLIETKYHELYKESDDWVQAKLDQAAIDGYVTAAFGLRLRTPLLKQVIRGIRNTPYEAQAEGRTAGNALGQSWGLLNNRAVMAFMRKVRAHPKYRLMIRPCAQIHDANYYIIDDDPELLIWLNQKLVKEVKWQNHPDIWHDQVKLGGEVDVFWPSWAEPMNIPNDLPLSELPNIIQNHLTYLEKKGLL